VKSENSMAAIKACEAAIGDEIDYNVEHRIYPADVLVAKRFLHRRDELTTAYEELYERLAGRPGALNEFFDSLFGTMTVWGPKQAAEARNARDRLVDVNQKIATLSKELSNLLLERESLNNNSRHHDNTHSHICDVIEDASAGNAHYEGWLKRPLEGLACQFDFKYWPKLHDIVDAISHDAAGAAIEASDNITRASTATTRPSRADFLRAFFAALNERSQRGHSRMPQSFTLSDETLASLMNCVLNLGPDDGVDGAYVKNFRYRERKRMSAEN